MHDSKSALKMGLSFEVDLLKSLKIKIKTLDFLIKEFSKDFQWSFIKDVYRGILEEFLLRIFVRETLEKLFDMGSILNETLSRCKKNGSFKWHPILAKSKI